MAPERVLATEGPEDNLSLIEIETPDPAYQILPVRILDRSTYEALTFDPHQQRFATISYWLTKPARIRIRMVRRDQKDLVLRTLLDWVPQKFGRNEVRWDGRDACGNLIDNRKMLFIFEGDSPLHQEHDPEKCHELRLRIISPESGATISRLSEISIKIRENSGYGKESGYELRVYVDYSLVFKRSLGRNSERFRLPDVSTIEDGEHLVTINFDDYHDHIGTLSIKVNIQRT